MSKPWEKYYSDAARALAKAPPSGCTLAQMARDVVAAHPDRRALTTFLANGAEVTVSYAEMGAKSDAFAAYLTAKPPMALCLIGGWRSKP